MLFITTTNKVGIMTRHKEDVSITVSRVPKTSCYKALWMFHFQPNSHCELRCISYRLNQPTLPRDHWDA